MTKRRLGLMLNGYMMLEEDQADLPELNQDQYQYRINLLHKQQVFKV